jgi:hypothetical protein
MNHDANERRQVRGEPRQNLGNSLNLIPPADAPITITSRGIFSPLIDVLICRLYASAAPDLTDN